MFISNISHGGGRRHHLRKRSKKDRVLGTRSLGGGGGRARGRCQGHAGGEGWAAFKEKHQRAHKKKRNGGVGEGVNQLPKSFGRKVSGGS